MYLLRKAARELQGRTEVHGLPISIENRRGSIRQWTNPDTGKEGMTRMNIDEFRATLPECKGEKITGGRFITTQELEEAAKRAHPHGLEGFVKAAIEPTESDDTGESPAIQNFKASWKQVTSQMRKSKSEFEMGMKEEREHDDITDGDPELIEKIVRAHLKEDPHYYSKIKAALKKSHVETVSRKPTVRRTAHGVYLVRNTTAKVHKSDKEVKAAHEGISGKSEEALRAIAKERGIYIPPAWTDIWVNKDPNAGLQAKGRDKKGVLQRAYTKQHYDTQAADKFERVATFAKSYTKIMKEIEADIPTREPAQILYLIAKMGFRLGNEKERGEVKAYGASNLLASHIAVKGDTTIFAFIGKKGVPIYQKTKDPKIKEIVTGKRGKLFKEATPEGIRTYMAEIGFGDYLVKDFRTLLAMSISLKAVKTMPAPTTQAEYKKAVKAVCQKVADKLGNTAAVAKASYIPPEVFSKWTI